MIIDKEFIQCYNKYIQKTLKRHHAQDKDMPDLIQDVYEKLVLYQDYYEEKWDSNVKNYIFYICRHCVNRRYRGHDVLDMTDSLDIHVTVDGENIPMEETLTPEDSVTNEGSDLFYLQNTEEVLEMIEQLRYPQREVLRHKLIMGKSHKEIACILQISETNSKTLLHRGIEQLRKIVSGEEEVELLQHKFKGMHQQSIRTNDETGVDVWNDWSWKPQPPSNVKEFTPEEIQQYLKGE